MKFRSLILVLTAISISACKPSVPTEQGLVISDARVQAPLKGKVITAGYFDITNHSKVDDAIIGIESPISGKAELHKSEEVDGVMKMRRQVSVDLGAGETVTFNPGGYHIMFFDVKLGQDAKDAALTFKFKHAPDVVIIADIVDGSSHAAHH